MDCGRFIFIWCWMQVIYFEVCYSVQSILGCFINFLNKEINKIILQVQCCGIVSVVIKYNVCDILRDDIVGIEKIIESFIQYQYKWEIVVKNGSWFMEIFIFIFELICSEMFDMNLLLVQFMCFFR